VEGIALINNIPNPNFIRVGQVLRIPMLRPGYSFFYERINFDPGATSAVRQWSVVRGDRDVYSLNARAGQQMVISISSLEGNAVFQICLPSGGQALPGAGERDDATGWSGVLPMSGDYMIVVGGTRGNASYRLEVAIV
jgi:hypothetical protein